MGVRTEPPVDLSVPAELVRSRLAAGRGDISDATVRRFRDSCAFVATDETALVAASRDWWPLSLRWARRGLVPALPQVVARPAAASEVADVLRVCNEERIPVTVSGGRSGVCGGAVPVHGGVALDLLDLEGIASVDDASCLVEVGAGTLGVELEDELRREHALTLGHWPQSISLSAVGGWIACRAAGQYSTRYGKIEDIVAGLEAILADGSTVRTGSLAGQGPRAAMGPDLTQLFVGSEGTLAVVTSAQLRAHPQPASEQRAAWAFRTFRDGLDAVRRTLRRGATPAVVRLYDPDESQRNFGCDAGSVLIALDEGDASIVTASMDVLAGECAGAERLDASYVDQWYATRNDVSVLGAVINAGMVVDTIEVATAWKRLPALYEDAIDGLRRLDGIVAASAHQSHAYIDGACLYFTFAGAGPNPEDDEWAESFYRRAWAAVMRATRTHGGSISHHHGIGLVRASWLPKALGDGYQVLQALKAALDPKGILNPGKLGLPSRFGDTGW
jgi:alkyldihydroxyacetonephosphate synthase